MGFNRGVAVLALAFIAGVFIIAALGTELLYGNQGKTQWITIWYYCNINPNNGPAAVCQQLGDGNLLSCDSQLQFVRAIQAFYCLSAIFAVVALVVANVEAFIAQQKKGVLAVAVLPLFIFTLIAWVLGFSFTKGSFCGGESFNTLDFKYGPSAPLMFIAWFWALVALGAAAALPGKDDGAAAPAPAAPAVAATSEPVSA